MFLDRPLPVYDDLQLAQRAEQAKRYLNDPFFQSIMAEAEAILMMNWRTNSDADAREACWLACKGLDTVMQSLRATVDSAPDVLTSTTS